MNLLMDSFWMGFAAGVMVGGMLGLLLAGLLRHASDAEIRLDRHLEELDEFEEKLK